MPSRVNLGVVGASLWQREDKTKISKKIKKKDKERLVHHQQACNIQEQSPETTVVSIADRSELRRPLFLYAVYVKETVPPISDKGVEWMLLTDLL